MSNVRKRSTDGGNISSIIGSLRMICIMYMRVTATVRLGSITTIHTFSLICLAVLKMDQGGIQSIPLRDFTEEIISIKDARKKYFSVVLNGLNMTVPKGAM